MQVDALYEAYLNAALILWGLNKDNAFVDAGNHGWWLPEAPGPDHRVLLPASAFAAFVSRFGHDGELRGRVGAVKSSPECLPAGRAVLECATTE